MKTLVTISLLLTLTISETTAPSNFHEEIFPLPSLVSATAGTTIDHLRDLHKELPGGSQLVRVKIRNKQKEVIAKWFSKGLYVVPKMTTFLRRASTGVYDIEVSLSDGTKKNFHYIKR